VELMVKYDVKSDVGASLREGISFSVHNLDQGG